LRRVAVGEANCITPLLVTKRQTAYWERCGMRGIKNEKTILTTYFYWGTIPLSPHKILVTHAILAFWRIADLKKSFSFILQKKEGFVCKE